MTLYYEIETNSYIDRHGEKIIETDAVEFEVDDFDILCAYMKDFSPYKKMALVTAWCNDTKEGRAELIGEIMEKHGHEIEELFRQRALDGAFCPVRRENRSDGRIIDGEKNAAYSAN